MQVVSRVKMSFLRRVQKCGVENVCIHQNKIFFIASASPAPAFISPPTSQKEISVNKTALYRTVDYDYWSSLQSEGMQGKPK